MDFIQYKWLPDSSKRSYNSLQDCDLDCTFIWALSYQHIPPRTYSAQIEDSACDGKRSPKQNPREPSEPHTSSILLILMDPPVSRRHSQRRAQPRQPLAKPSLRKASCSPALPLRPPRLLHATEPSERLILFVREPQSRSLVARFKPNRYFTCNVNAVVWWQPTLRRCCCCCMVVSLTLDDGTYAERQAQKG